MENSLDEMGGFDLPTGTKCPKNASWAEHSFWVRLEHFWHFLWGTTKKDMAEMKDLFNLFDIDGNGSITQEPFNDYLRPKTI